MENSFFDNISILIIIQYQACGSKTRKYLESITTDYGPLKTLTASGGKINKFIIIYQRPLLQDFSSPTLRNASVVHALMRCLHHHLKSLRRMKSGRTATRRRVTNKKYLHSRAKILKWRNRNINESESLQSIWMILMVNEIRARRGKKSQRKRRVVPKLPHPLHQV